MAPRVLLAAVCVLFLAAMPNLSTPACGSSLLLGGGGFVLSRPLLLQGVDVGAALSDMQEALSTVQDTLLTTQQVLQTTQAALQTAQDDIAELKLENAQLQGNLTAAAVQISELQRSDAKHTSGLALHAAQLDSLEQFQGRAETALSVLNGTVTEHGTRLATAESDLTGLDVRLTTAETLGLPSTPLTETLAAVRDLSAGTPLYTAVNNLRTLTPGTMLTDTLIQVRDLNAGTPLYTAVTDQNTRLTAAESLSGVPSSALYTAVTGLQSTVSGQGTRLTAAEGGLTDLTTRVAAAENLNGTATTLTTTVLALRDLTGGSTLVTTVTGLRDNSGSSALVTTLGSLRNKTDTGSVLIRSLPCYGETDPSSWEEYPTTSVFVNVSMAACGFSVPPQHVSASLYGNSGHWMTLGASSIYPVSATSFRVYIMPVKVQSPGPNIINYPLTLAQVAAANWRISWMAAL